MFARINQVVLERLAAYKSQDDGQTMAEYGLILALVAVVLIGAFQLLEGRIDGMLAAVTTGL